MMKGESAIHAFMKAMERIEDLVLAGFNLPLTPWTVVNGDQLLPLLDHVREVLPEEVVQARLILERRDDIIADAQRKGSFTLEEAKRQAETMLNNSALMRAVEDEATKIRHQLMTEMEAYRKQVNDEADGIRRSAVEDARKIREGADTYASQVLTSLEKDLTSFHQVVKTGQQHLRQVQHEATRNQRQAAAMPAPSMSGHMNAVQQQQMQMADPRSAMMPPDLQQVAQPAQPMMQGAQGPAMPNARVRRPVVGGGAPVQGERRGVADKRRMSAALREQLLQPLAGE